MKQIVALLFVAGLVAGKEKKVRLSPLDAYILEAGNRPSAVAVGAAGSLWSPSASLLDLAGDLRARRIDDLVTVVVFDRASALAAGATRSNRSSSASASIDLPAGPLAATGRRLANLARLGGESQLEGGGETSRETLLSTTLTARVTHVLPNGYLVVQGTKNVAVNSEVQLVTVRGVVRPIDLVPQNTVYSDQLGQLEVTVNGRGVVGDAIRRPNFLYRLLLGVLPF